MSHEYMGMAEDLPDATEETFKPCYSHTSSCQTPTMCTLKRRCEAACTTGIPYHAPAAKGTTFALVTPPNPETQKQVAKIIADVVTSELDREEEESKGLTRRDGGRHLVIHSAARTIIDLVMEGIR